MTLHSLMGAGCLLGLVLGILCTAQEAQIKKVPLRRANPASGQEMYTSYCAVCHGADGKGKGPAAKALTSVPPDLTLLAAHNQRTFPEMHVYNAIRGDANMPAAHGVPDMPVWSALFRESCGGMPTESDVQQRVANLTGYVKSLQKSE